MPLIIKKKAVPVTAVVVESDLDDVGLTPEVSILNQIVNHPRLLKNGTRVICLEPGIGAWYPYWQPGDTGVVQKGYLAAGAYDNQPEHDVYLLLMDKPRDPKHPEAHLHSRQIRVLEDEGIKLPKQRPVPDPIKGASKPLPTVVKKAPIPVLVSSSSVPPMGISKIKKG